MLVFSFVFLLFSVLLFFFLGDKPLLYKIAIPFICFLVLNFIMLGFLYYAVSTDSGYNQAKSDLEKEKKLLSFSYKALESIQVTLEKVEKEKPLEVEYILLLKEEMNKTQESIRLRENKIKKLRGNIFS